MLNLNSIEKIVQFVIDPLSHSPLQGQLDEELGTQFTTKIALTLKAIWSLRNIVAHGRGIVISFLQSIP